MGRALAMSWFFCGLCAMADFLDVADCRHVDGADCLYVGADFGYVAGGRACAGAYGRGWRGRAGQGPGASRAWHGVA